MEEYKMRRGEYLEERIPDLESTVQEYFGEITDTQEYNDSDLFVIENPENPVFERIVVGAVTYGSKKDTLAVNFEERELEDLMETGDVDTAGDANTAKNEFLLEATGRDAKARRDSMKRDVEDEAPDDF
ncbi:hypothetical protein DM867_02055 [Halosegnis rubeus]|jgi:hypothetical protein|uniref:DUF5611 domain-containing protein n=1 Tax=Halosegnis rubeus TaxID=2212850 RepID=A0A5N5UQD6_9EURY|nr:DUF5611 family protein [Halosegnis rubeus]KAB7515948.1 hypothetical protein DM867_02055 [Halosegnis rubeus]KAB7516839.1 hypothetical protein DMP03_05595 [Halosegnis rubeus]KAB7520034.1 hypothetical protein DP108_01940 [Halosegnis rubeus]